MRLQAVNNVIIVKKDPSDFSQMNDVNYKAESFQEIPEPYSGVIDSIGEDCEYSIGQRICFQDYGGVYIQVDSDELVVITPEMVIGILD
jgi:hypothetical protein